MPVIYIGRTHDQVGKALWEIVGNLKNHGVGRMVIRNNEQKYPEASYMRILKVVGLPDTSTHIHNPRQVMALVQKTFRGKTLSEPFQIDSTSCKTDYMLVPKDEEAKYLNSTEQPAIRIMPQTTDFPPLLKLILTRNMKLENQEVPDLKLKLVYNLSGFKSYKIAEEGETPTETVSVKLGKPASPSLYANIKTGSVS
ncbi:mitochondrial ribosomal protein S34 [Xylocopa sonorina]|uniref:mitochondrial ribosomal protein S34 n=1 Tax=Xylocopa sonorina TaxID=1818115 RepID=UPI00403B1994